MLLEKSARGGLLRPRAVYGWLHHHSGEIFIAVVFLLFLRTGLHAASPPLAPSPYSSSQSSLKSKGAALLGWSSSTQSPAQHHPIPSLMDAAATRFRSKLARQSPTVAGAIAEYTRRNSRPPPRGFAKWHAFAQSRQFFLIDEFDSVSEDLEAFWGLSGRELRERAALAARLPGIDLVRVRGGKARAVRVVRSENGNGTETETGEGVSGRAQGLLAMMEAFVHELPDMDFPVNARPDGRVLVPWEHRAYPNLTEAVEARASTLLDPTTWRPDWAGEGSVWDAWRRTCAPTAAARRLYSSLRVGGVGSNSKGAHNAQPELTFAEGTGSRAGTDWCAAPARRYEQGHLFSDWRALPALVPVFSPARAPGFADIRIPSHYYWGGTRRYTYGWDPVNLEQHTMDAMEVPWEKKRDAVWWRGASTGGGSSPSGFSAGYQRHRFLRMASVGLVSGSGSTSAGAGKTGTGKSEPTTQLTFAVPPQPVWHGGGNDSAGVYAEAYGAEHSSTQNGGENPSMRNAQYASTRNRSNTAAAGGKAKGPAVGTFTTARVPLSALNADVMDAAVVKTVLPIGAEHRVADSVEMGVGWGYKYLLDLDGNSYSGRFMAFLASDSVPVKATVYDEYFSGWLEPWVHYIPLSATYSEVYNIVAYFSGPPPAALRAANLSAAASTYAPARGSAPREPVPGRERHPTPDKALDYAKENTIGASDPRRPTPRRSLFRRQEQIGETEEQAAAREAAQEEAYGAGGEGFVPGRTAAQEEGDRRLRRIARAGKQWKKTMGRTADMEVYVYRLALEYGRLWADDREAMAYDASTGGA